MMSSIKSMGISDLEALLMIALTRRTSGILGL